MAAGGAANGAEPFQPLHRHADARLILFVSGRYRERGFGEGDEFGPGHIIVRPAYYAHDGLALTRDARYVHFRTRPNALRDFFAQHGWRARRAVLGGDWRDLLAAARDPDAGETLLRDVTAPLPSAPGGSLSADVARAIVNEDERRLGDIAEALNVRPWELTRRFARAFGMSPNRYRREARVQAALRLLADSSASLAAIAAETGFADQSHLGRAVRAVTGCTPIQVRRQLAA